ncbi:MAG: Kae1-associated serine/threonine protein kinase [Candidatus Marsarchaeota archaeon]|nr:Kae1-associated serine/threonine protein kinase [Candidatus Marsarchaeota archaeon]
MEKISEGAEAEIYDAKVLGRSAILKYRIEKGYRTRPLDYRIRSERTKSEAKIMARASARGAMVPKVLLIDGYGIYIEKLDGAMLNAMMDRFEKQKEKMRKILEEAGKQLGMLHNADIVHGDYTPANILVTPEGVVYVIDFGLAEITNSVEEKALDLLLMKRSISKTLYPIFEDSYRKSHGDSKSVLLKLGDIERRGRYQTRTLITG